MPGTNNPQPFEPFLPVTISYNPAPASSGMLRTMTDRPNPALTPRLVVRGAAKAIDFYTNALGARVLERFEDKKIGKIVHSALELEGSVFAVVDSAPDWGNDSPADLEGSAVIMTYMTDDPDAVGAALEKHGAEVVFPIKDQFYGHREGRFRDPFGHLWIVGRVTEALSAEEIQQRVDAFEP